MGLSSTHPHVRASSSPCLCVSCNEVVTFLLFWLDLGLHLVLILWALLERILFHPYLINPQAHLCSVISSQWTYYPTQLEAMFFVLQSVWVGWAHSLSWDRQSHLLFWPNMIYDATLPGGSLRPFGCAMTSEKNHSTLEPLLHLYSSNHCLVANVLLL